MSTISPRTSIVFQYLILLLISLLAFSIRLFSVIKSEAMIHEFDPYFNYRSTLKLITDGLFEFNNWYDELTWYPLGRHIGNTLYPGLMFTAGIIYHCFNYINLTINITNTCVFLAPLMASLTTLSVFLLTSEIWDESAGLFSSAFIAIIPGYISRSVAGSYDNEAVAIFALCFSFYTWVKAVKTGTIAWACTAALAYFYMVAAWGGYIFIINLIPAHALILVLMGKYTSKLYVAYSTFYVIGTISSFTVPMVGFIPVSSPEHMAAFGVFGLYQIIFLYNVLSKHLSVAEFNKLQHYVLFYVIPASIAGVVVLSIAGFFPRLTGRLLSLLGSTSNIAIVKSVSEHQPTPWGSLFFDLNIVLMFVPIGLYFCFSKLNEGTLFIILYMLFISYFAGIMIRLVLVFAPAATVLAGIAASEILNTLISRMSFRAREGDLPPLIKKDKNDKTAAAAHGEVEGDVFLGVYSFIMVIAFSAVFYFYVIHCSWVTSHAYSSPSVVLSAQQHDGSKIIFDDFREAYYWLRTNTAENAKIMSWWDYGYQITTMGHRTTIVDNNTRNNTHIATVGYAMASPESRAYPVLLRLNVDYVLVVFGGMIGYASDDINKFLWMIRIGGGTFPEVVEEDYYNGRSEFRIDSEGSQTLANSLMYKMCYYRFGEMQTEYNQPTGYDRVRRTVVGNKNIQFEHLEEAYTTEHWMVRIYRVLPPKKLPDPLLTSTTTKSVRKNARAGLSLYSKTRKLRLERRKELVAKRKLRKSNLSSKSRK